MLTNEASADVLIVGGGLGGTAAGLAAARLGCRVLLTEETDWIGGQLTAQGVPPDEHPWIEQTGCTRSYRALRNAVRAFYRANYPLRPQARANSHLNPGSGWVGNLCHEPRVGALVLDDMLKPFVAPGRLRIVRGCRPVEVDLHADRITGVSLEDVNRAKLLHASAPFVLDATELGDLLGLAKVEHVSGAEG
jgi:2-polyprenyl-6-methoxyphenol hydroxylase-like FAD-dependent oxidoreductase